MGFQAVLSGDWMDDFKVTSGECWPLLTILDGKSMGHL